MIELTTAGRLFTGCLVSLRGNPYPHVIWILGNTIAVHQMNGEPNFTSGAYYFPDLYEIEHENNLGLKRVTSPPFIDEMMAVIQNKGSSNLTSEIFS